MSLSRIFAENCCGPKSTSDRKIGRLCLVVTLDEVVTLARGEMRGKARRHIVLDASSALTDIGLSSLQIAEVIFSLEETHEASFADHLAANAKTLGDLVVLANEAMAQRDGIDSAPAR